VEHFTGLQGRAPYVFQGNSMGADRFGIISAAQQQRLSTK
jgi:hypothetical protein